MCTQAKVGTPKLNIKPLISHNLIITARWVAIITRTKESYMGFNINALGFAGYFLLNDRSNKEWFLNDNAETLLACVV